MVTGATGYIATWIVKRLLEAGHTVHATLRDPNNATSVVPLKAIAEAAPQGRLKLFQADLLAVGSFDGAAQGCEVVLHTASPFIVRGFTDAHEALTRPALEGTRNVLHAVQRAETVKRVVLTSSVSAIYGDNADLQGHPRGSFDEQDWNTTSSEEHVPYSYSKLVAEREAWAQAEAQNRWRLVAINPSMVVGPALTRATASTSVATLRDMGTGKLRTGVPRFTIGWVDVRDVAQAHVQAAYRPDAQGRHIVSARELSLLEVATILRQHFGSAYPFPTFELPKPLVKLVGPLADAAMTRRYVDRNVGYPLRLNNQRSKDRLGLNYRDIANTLVEHFQQMLDDGVVRRR